MNTGHFDLSHDLIQLISEERPRTIVLASVHRPTFTQQLTVLRDQRPDGRAQGTVKVLTPRLRALDINRTGTAQFSRRAPA